MAAAPPAFLALPAPSSDPVRVLSRGADGSCPGAGAGRSCPRGLMGPGQGRRRVLPWRGQFQAPAPSQPALPGPLALTRGWSVPSPPCFCAVLQRACSGQRTPVGYSEPPRSRVPCRPTAASRPSRAPRSVGPAACGFISTCLCPGAQGAAFHCVLL